MTAAGPLTWSQRPADHWATAEAPSDAWIPLPLDFDGTPWPDATAYAAWAAETVAARHAADAPSDLHDRCEQTIVSAYETLVGTVPAHLHFLYWPDPAKPPLPVFVALWQAEHSTEDALLYYSGARTGEETEGAEPPILEIFISDHLGEGLRVLRFDSFGSLGDGSAGSSEALLATLGYAWRAEAHAMDVQMFAFTPDLGLLYAALVDLDAFARVIVPTPDPGT